MRYKEVTKIIKGNKLIFKVFYDKTIIDNFSKDSLDPKSWPKAWRKVHFKTYPRFEKVVLPKKLEKLNVSLRGVLLKRNSSREYFGALSLSQIATIVYYSSGLVYPFRNFDESRRFYPSAGARYPLEIYLASFNIETLGRGVYHYSPKTNSFEFLLKEKNIAKIMAEITGQDWVKESSAVLIISAIYKRTEIKYGSRGFRYILLEAGHVGQSIYLIASALKLKCCAIGGYLDREINALLDLDPDQEIVLYLIALAK